MKPFDDSRCTSLPAGVSRTEVFALVERILASNAFAATKRLGHFLKYVTAAVLEERSKDVKEYNIAVDVFERRASFDSRIDPIVRVQATRLRSKIKKYFHEE